MTNGALFIPLKREYFERFAARTKTVEFRPFGPRWNFRTCALGRRVVLSLGFGKKHRLTGFVQSFRIAEESERDEIPGWRECYGEDPRPIACIGVHVQDWPNAEMSQSPPRPEAPQSQPGQSR